MGKYDFSPFHTILYRHFFLFFDPCMQLKAVGESAYLSDGDGGVHHLDPIWFMFNQRIHTQWPKTFLVAMYFFCFVLFCAILNICNFFSISTPISPLVRRRCSPSERYKSSQFLSYFRHICTQKQEQLHLFTFAASTWAQLLLFPTFVERISIEWQNRWNYDGKLIFRNGAIVGNH